MKAWNTKLWKQRREEILKVRGKCEWCGLTQKESLENYNRGLSIDHIREHIPGPRENKKYSFERYIELKDEDIRVLCLRCHKAKTEGYVLCPKCKKHYRSPQYDACKHCNKEKIEERKRDPDGWARKKAEAEAERERQEELHEKQFNYGLDHPELRHLKLWNCSECREPIDFQHFCAFQCCDVCLKLYYQDYNGQNAEQEF